MDTFSLISGYKSTLPVNLWNYFIKAIDLYIARKYNSELKRDTELWTIIPNEHRKWVKIEELEKSFFSKKKDLIGLDFNSNFPLIGDGDYWLKVIQDSINKKSTLECRNIYVFDTSMKIFVFYIEGGGILIEGELTKIIIKQ